MLGNSTERDILNARLQGQSWAGLSAAACNDVALADKVAALSLEDTITCIEVSHMLEKKPSEILETGSTLQLKTEAATELSNKRQIKSTLTNEFCDFAAPLAEAKQEIPQIDEATLQDMLKSGYRIRDIKAVVQGEATVTESQINIKQIIESERDGGEAQ